MSFSAAVIRSAKDFFSSVIPVGRCSACSWEENLLKAQNCIPYSYRLRNRQKMTDSCHHTDSSWIALCGLFPAVFTFVLNHFWWFSLKIPFWRGKQEPTGYLTDLFTLLLIWMLFIHWLIWCVLSRFAEMSAFSWIRCSVCFREPLAN